VRSVAVVTERTSAPGTTLNATNGRDNLLGVPVTVPMVSANGTDVLVRIEVRAHRLDAEHRVFLARFHAA
jgi:hypothetical protein